jgi:hypothetical protein
MKSILRILVASCSLSVPALAGTPIVEDIAPQTTDSGWWWKVAPYAWVTDISGDAGVAYNVVPVDISMSDVIENLDMSFFLAVEAGKGNWTFGFDGVYADLSTNAPAPTRLFRSSNIRLEQFFARAHVGYTLLDDGQNYVNIFGGARYSYVNTDLTLVGIGGGLFPFSVSEGWFDPVVGLQWRTRLGDRWIMHFGGDIGAGSSDLVWQANLLFGYEFTERTTGFIGYRAFGVDYSDGGFLLDIVAHGPAFGLAIEF